MEQKPMMNEIHCRYVVLTNLKTRRNTEQNIFCFQFVMNL